MRNWKIRRLGEEELHTLRIRSLTRDPHEENWSPAKEADERRGDEQRCARAECGHYRAFHRSPIVSETECDMPGCKCPAFKERRSP